MDFTVVFRNKKYNKRHAVIKHRVTKKIVNVLQGPGDASSEESSEESSGNGNSLANISTALSSTVSEIKSIISKILTMNDLNAIPGQLHQIYKSIMKLLDSISISKLINLVINNIDLLEVIPGVGTVFGTIKGTLEPIIAIAKIAWTVINTALSNVNSVLPVPLQQLACSN